MKITISRNKREGYYAGFYRLKHTGLKERKRHWRWDAWSMSEFYPPIHGCVFKILERQGII